jgi:hypothetical protein
MTVDNAPPLVVVGMEGLWGTLLMPLIVFPWSYILPGTGKLYRHMQYVWVCFLISSNNKYFVCIRFDYNHKVDIWIGGGWYIW